MKSILVLILLLAFTPVMADTTEEQLQRARMTQAYATYLQNPDLAEAAIAVIAAEAACNGPKDVILAKDNNDGLNYDIRDLRSNSNDGVLTSTELMIYADQVGNEIDGIIFPAINLLGNACNDIVACAKAIDDTCRAVKRGKGATSSIKRKVTQGGSSENCDGTCTDGSTVQVLCVRP